MNRIASGIEFQHDDGSARQGPSQKCLRCVTAQALVLALLCASLTAFAGSALAQQGTFVSTGSLNTARSGHTATLLNNGIVLIAGGSDATGTLLASAELYDPATGTFTATGSMTTPRGGHTATLLNNGTVLIVGGSGFNATAELYDPTTGTFSTTGSLNTARSGHTATLLNNGIVLITGGNSAVSPLPSLASAELYDPATGTFTPTGSMTAARHGDTATLLNNGKVLVAGGFNYPGSLWASAELYDATAGTFSATGSMTAAREEHTATLLNSGMVLIAGGIGTPNPELASAELYNPSTGIFTATGSMTAARQEHTATLLNNGKVLIAGGLNSILLASAELYDPSMGTFTPTGGMETVRFADSATLLNNGLVLIAAGNASGGAPQPVASAELYELITVVPSSLSFSNQAVAAASPPQTVTLTNNESIALSITSITVTGPSASDFGETDNCIGSVAVGASCSINVTFTPAALGTRTGTLTIANNLSVSPLLVPLTGTGVTTTRIASLSASSLTFPAQTVGSTSAAQQLTLSNTGNMPLTISSLVVGGTNGSDFAETDNCDGSVAAGASCTINVTFSPKAIGARTATLTITDNATSPQSPQTVTLTGTGQTALMTLAPSSISFPSQYVGTSGLPQNVTVTNNGNAPLSITSVTARPGDFGPLSSCGNSLSAGASCSIGVFFDPKAGGTRTGTLTVTDSASGSPQTAALSGVGQDFSLSATSFQSVTVTPGQTASYSLMISPSGGFNKPVSLACSGAPAQSTCVVSPSPVALSGSSAAITMVTVTTQAASVPATGPSARGGYRLLYIVTGLLGLIGLLTRRRVSGPRLAYGLVLLLLCAGMLMAACGGGGGGGSGGTPAGTYNLVVSGTFAAGPNTLTRTSTLTLRVQ